MPFNDSPRGLIQDAVPDGDEDPVIDEHLALLLSKIEPWLVMYAPDVATATTTLAPLRDGMVLVTPVGGGRLYVRVAGAWLKVWPKYSYGTAAPNAATMDVGDVYFQHA